jgi:hypothetical protein
MTGMSKKWRRNDYNIYNQNMAKSLISDDVDDD